MSEDLHPPERLPLEEFPTKPVRQNRAIHGRCPRCGEGRLFANWLQFVPACEVCGLDFEHSDIGDGGAYLTIVGMGGLITFFATIIEVVYSPPYWLHAVLWVPLAIFGSLGMLHYTKAWMLATAFRNHLMDGSDPS